MDSNYIIHSLLSFPVLVSFRFVSFRSQPRGKGIFLNQGEILGGGGVFLGNLGGVGVGRLNIGKEGRNCEITLYRRLHRYDTWNPS